jgi:hypothetical protein
MQNAWLGTAPPRAMQLLRRVSESHISDSLWVRLVSPLRLPPTDSSPHSRCFPYVLISELSQHEDWRHSSWLLPTQPGLELTEVSTQGESPLPPPHRKAKTGVGLHTKADSLR